MSIRILLADDHQITREGIRTLLEQQEDFTVIGEASTGREVVDSVDRLGPDVILMDINMPDIDGIQATRQILTRVPAAKILALSMHFEKHYIQEMRKAGALGYVAKDCDYRELVEAIRHVESGKSYLGRALWGVVSEDYMSQAPDRNGNGHALLTERENEVLRLMADGLSMKEIAYHMGKSPKTIEARRRRIMEKLKINSVAELTKYAIREGLTSL